MGMPELEIYSMIGAEGFGRLVAAFYRQVPQDDRLGPIYPASDLPGAEQRLRVRVSVFAAVRRPPVARPPAETPGCP
jgi:truncated hemoglobin YjbI